MATEPTETSNGAASAEPKRGPGRPVKPLEQRVVKRDVKIPPDVFDEYCRRARRRNVAVHKVMVEALVAEARRRPTS